MQLAGLERAWLPLSSYHHGGSLEFECYDERVAGDDSAMRISVPAM